MSLEVCEKNKNVYYINCRAGTVPYSVPSRRIHHQRVNNNLASVCQSTLRREGLVPQPARIASQSDAGGPFQPYNNYIMTRNPLRLTRLRLAGSSQIRVIVLQEPQEALL